MAKFWEDWRTSTLDAEPSGWTKLFVTAGTLYRVEADTSGHAPAGRRLLIDKSATDRAAIRFDAVGTSEADVQVRLLVRSVGGAVAQYGGPAARLAGAAGTETALYGALTSSGQIGNVQLNAGASSVLGYGGSAGVYTSSGYYWLTITTSGGTVTTTIASVATPETIIDTATHTAAVVGAGGVGIFSSWSTAILHVLAVGVGTGGDVAPYAPLAPTTAPTIGTITTSGTTASVPYTGLDPYATGVEYRIDGGAWVDAGAASPISLAGLTESTEYDIELRAYNAAGPGPVSTLATFTTTAGTLVKGATITLYNGSTPHASLTDLRVLWWDATAPDGTAPDYYSATESTDAAGLLSIDLNAVTALSVGDYGYLHVHKAGTLGNAYQDALVFAGAVQVQDIG